MVIIIEGPDSVGKSTVAAELNKIMPLSHVLKLSGAPSKYDELVYMERVYRSLIPYFKSINHDKQHIILDRFTTSERVYSALCKDYDPSRYLSQYEYELMKEVSTYQFILVFHDWDVAEERLEKKRMECPNEEHPDLIQLQKIQNMYMNIALGRLAAPKNSEFDSAIICVDTFTPEEIADIICNHLKIKPKNIDTTYTGF